MSTPINLKKAGAVKAGSMALSAKLSQMKETGTFSAPDTTDAPPKQNVQNSGSWITANQSVSTPRSIDSSESPTDKSAQKTPSVSAKLASWVRPQKNEDVTENPVKSTPTPRFNRNIASQYANADGKKDVEPLVIADQLQVDESNLRLSSNAGSYDNMSGLEIDSESSTALSPRYSAPPLQPAARTGSILRAPKCRLCSENVYKLEEVVHAGFSWHKLCFKCGGVGSDGCKRVFTTDKVFEHNCNPYCENCNNLLFKPKPVTAMPNSRSSESLKSTGENEPRSEFKVASGSSKQVSPANSNLSEKKSQISPSFLSPSNAFKINKPSDAASQSVHERKPGISAEAPTSPVSVKVSEITGRQRSSTTADIRQPELSAHPLFDKKPQPLKPALAPSTPSTGVKQSELLSRFEKKTLPLPSPAPNPSPSPAPTESKQTDTSRPLGDRKPQPIAYQGYVASEQSNRQFLSDKKPQPVGAQSGPAAAVSQDAKQSESTGRTFGEKKPLPVNNQASNLESKQPEPTGRPFVEKKPQPVVASSTTTRDFTASTGSKPLPVSQTTVSKFSQIGGAIAPKCTSCAKTVYKVEEVVAVGRTWHKSCFKCGGTAGGGCGRCLTLDKYLDHDNQPFCSSCHAKNFKPKVVGY